MLRPTVLGIMLALSAVRLTSQEQDAVLGTWVLNVAKSTYSPGPAPRSESQTYVIEGHETRMTARGASEPRTYASVRHEIKAASTVVLGEGTSITTEWTVVYDGKDRPIAGDPDADAISFQRIDALTAAFTQKKAGRIVMTGTRTIAKDEKVMTVMISGIDARNRAVLNVSVYEKRPE